MTTRLDQVRAAHVALLGAIAGIGCVHGYERYARDEAKFRELYLADIGGGKKQIRGWYVRRVTTAETSAAMGDYEDSHTWDIRGFMAFDDEAQSEILFDGFIEAVRDAYRADQTLGGLIASVFSPSGEGPKLIDSRPVLFGGVLCHSAHIQLTTWYAL